MSVLAMHPPQVIVAGHICVDVIPRFDHTGFTSLAALLTPGKLNKVGPAVLATGGAVSNTGLALHRLGVPVQLMGKIGRDLFGEVILEILRAQDASLAEGMIVAPEEASSYTLVINPPGVDRIFLHCPGANDTFGAADVPLERMAQAQIFHFGYPPIMRRMYIDDGRELVELMRSVKETGVVTSLDMAQPDPASEAGQADWRRIIAGVLPFVDVFSPNIDEILYMLDRPRYEARQRGHAAPDGALLHDIAHQLLAMGAAVVALKLGEHGLYLRTSSDPSRLAALDGLVGAQQERWCNRELAIPCFQVHVAGTTGAGDCTVAGLLAALLRGVGPEEAIRAAVAVGACSVEHADATSGVPPWETVQARLAAGWPHHPMTLRLEGWRSDDEHIWSGPAI